LENDGWREEMECAFNGIKPNEVKPAPTPSEDKNKAELKKQLIFGKF
jgi:hypothetical protein